MRILLVCVLFSLLAHASFAQPSRQPDIGWLENKLREAVWIMNWGVNHNGAGQVVQLDPDAELGTVQIYSPSHSNRSEILSLSLIKSANSDALGSALILSFESDEDYYASKDADGEKTISATINTAGIEPVEVTLRELSPVMFSIELSTPVKRVSGDSSSLLEAVKTDKEIFIVYPAQTATGEQGNSQHISFALSGLDRVMAFSERILDLYL